MPSAEATRSKGTVIQFWVCCNRDRDVQRFRNDERTTLVPSDLTSFPQDLCSFPKGNFAGGHSTMLVFASGHYSILSLLMGTLQVYIFAIRHFSHYNNHFLA